MSPDTIDNTSVTEVSDEYGISRPTYYQAKANFDAAGIAGLVPKKPGPRGPHKVHGEVLAFLQGRLVPGEPVRARELARSIRNELGVEVHPRTIERALKKLPDEHATPVCSILSSAIAAQYEVLRMAALGEALPPMARSGLMLFLRRGMWG
jgi:transposase